MNVAPFPLLSDSPLQYIRLMPASRANKDYDADPQFYNLASTKQPYYLLSSTTEQLILNLQT